MPSALWAEQPSAAIFTVIHRIFELFGGEWSYLKENQIIKTKRELCITLCEQTFYNSAAL